MLPILHNRVVAAAGDAEAVARVVASGQWSCGSEVAALEKEIAALMGRKHGVCVASGSSAIRLALMEIGVSRGDEVIIPAYSCVALPNSVLALGAIPVPADVLFSSWVLDPNSVEAKITQRTKAILAVHMYGYPAPINALSHMGVPLIEDCAHGFGTVAGLSRPLGSQGDLAIASLYSTKFLGAGEGGIIMTNGVRQARRMRKFRDYADQPPHFLRGNEKMTDIEAALARNRIKHLSGNVLFRQKLAELYHSKLLPCAEKGLLFLPDITVPRIWYRFSVMLNKLSASQCIKLLGKAGIYAVKPAENWLLNVHRSFQVSSLAYRKIISLPFNQSISERQVDYIVDSLCSCLQRTSK